MKLFARTSEQGARNAVRAAVGAPFASGAYIADCKVQP